MLLDRQKTQALIDLELVERPKLKSPIAILGAQGLRSVGLIAIETLIKKLKPKLFARIFCSHFNVVWAGPCYLCPPGIPGAKSDDSGIWRIPRIELYYRSKPPLILTRGNQAEGIACYEIASELVELYSKLGVSQIIVLGAHGAGRGKIFYAVNSQELKSQLESRGYLPREPGEFYGLCGLVLGIAGLKGIKGYSLFAGTSPHPQLEYPDPAAAWDLVRNLCELLNLELSL